MVNEDLFNTIRAMPKIDLHRHLEGSVRLETLLEIAQQYDIMLPHGDVESLRPYVQIVADEPHNWQHFLGKFLVLRQFYRSPEIIRRVTREAVLDAAADNVKYLELRFTPQALNNLIGCSYDLIVSWVCEAAHDAQRESDILVRLIVSMNRHESVAIGEQVLQAALEYRSMGVAGVDIAGQEAVFSARPFRALFERAKEEGMGITIHAGEWAGETSIRDAVNDMGADRIGHGIRVLESEELVELLVERGTVLEVCPTSNVHSGIVHSVQEHPLPELYQRQLRTTINTDDPLVCNVTLSDEIMAVLTDTALTLDDVKNQIMTAAYAAFLPADEKATLVARFERWLN